MANNHQKSFEEGPGITLPGIEEKFILPERALFRYDGEVNDLAGNIAQTELYIRRRVKQQLNGISGLIGSMFDHLIVESVRAQVLAKIPGLSETSAYCYKHHVDDSTSAFVIAKRKGMEPSRSVFADGHESGELLQKLRQHKTMQQLVEKANIDLDVRRFRGEDFADIGGMLALKKAIEKGKRLEVPGFRHRPEVLPELRKAFDL